MSSDNSLRVRKFHEVLTRTHRGQAFASARKRRLREEQFYRDNEEARSLGISVDALRARRIRETQIMLAKIKTSGASIYDRLKVISRQDHRRY